VKPTAGRFEKRKKISIFNSHAIAAQLLKVLIEEVFRPVGAQVAPAVASAAAFRPCCRSSASRRRSAQPTEGITRMRSTTWRRTTRLTSSQGSKSSTMAMVPLVPIACQPRPGGAIWMARLACSRVVEEVGLRRAESRICRRADGFADPCPHRLPILAPPLSHAQLCGAKACASRLQVSHACLQSLWQAAWRPRAGQGSTCSKVSSTDCMRCHLANPQPHPKFSARAHGMPWRGTMRPLLAARHWRVTAGCATMKLPRPSVSPCTLATIRACVAIRAHSKETRSRI
jgi:hypothetical protein